MITHDQIVEVLKEVKDPEIMQSVWDLGLIYGVEIKGTSVKIRMTMTTPFCPYASELLEDVKSSLRKKIAGVADVQVEVVWEPPWSLDKVSPEIKAELGIVT